MECEAFLSGTYAQLLSTQNLPIPAWAWLNGLAHGDVDDIRALAKLRPGRDPVTIVAGLASAVLRQMDTRGVGLATIQSETLIPLETRLAAADSVLPRDADELAQAIRRAAAGAITSWRKDHWA